MYVLSHRYYSIVNSVRIILGNRILNQNHTRIYEAYVEHYPTPIQDSLPQFQMVRKIYSNSKHTEMRLER